MIWTNSSRFDDSETAAIWQRRGTCGQFLAAKSKADELELGVHRDPWDSFLDKSSTPL